MKKSADNRKKRGAYTTEEQVEAVRMLQENNFNYYKTSIQTGVARGTLQAWANKYSNEMSHNSKVAMIAESVEMNLARMKNVFFRKHYEQMSLLAEKAIQRALFLVETEEDLNKVNNTIKAISDFVNRVTGDGEDGSMQSRNVTLIEKTILQLNAAGGNHKMNNPN